MGNILYFRNDNDRKKAEEVIRTFCPELKFIKIRLDTKNMFEEEEIHFGKWDMDLEKRKIYYNREEVAILEKQWSILEFLVRDSDSFFSAAEIGYALNLKESDVEKYITNLNAKMLNLMGSPVIRSREERYFVGN